MAISSTTSAAAAGTGTSFNVDGVVSGLNTSALITQLMTLSQAPLNQLTAQQTAVKARDAAYQSISSQLITFQGSVQNLLLSTAINAKISTSTVPTVATATADSTAINGNFSITVANLATATSATSSGRLGTAANLAPGAFVTGAGPTGAGMATPPTAGTFTINGQKVTLSAVAGTDTWASLQTQIAALTGPAVTLNVVPGSNSVSLTSASPLQLGSPTDTSNFLSATRLLGAAQTGSAGAYTVASSQLLGEAQPSNALSSAGLNTTLTSTSGSFAINGVSINWANTDSINNILTRINSSAAGVTATYDPKQDKVSLTNSNTGAQSISLVDAAGSNLLAALNLTGAAQVAGVAAKYTTTQNGVTSTDQFSNSNIVIGAVQGVNVTLLSGGTTSLSTTQDTATATKNIQTFIAQFNSTVDVLDAATAISTTGTKGVLAGDPAITGLANQLRSIVTQAAVVPAGSAYATMGDIGISTGPYGSVAGTTNHLILDAGKLTTALQNNPQAVTQLLSGLSGTASLGSDPASTGLVQTATGSPYGQVYSGSYKVSFDPIGLTLSSVFTSSGGTISPATTSTFVAGGTNTTLIPGVSLLFQNPLPGSAGVATINYTVSGRGIFQTLNDYVSQSRGPTGIFTSESADATSTQSDLTAQIANQTVILAQRKASLQAQFTAMEVALASLQSQGAALSSSLGVASTTPAANSASSSSAAA
ncbi:MAG TPA: flagellar filament capping protein FliD [Chloroflexota bacterium]|nr:flagellar filament capping protein FliD [Chloroflexota bacterium]